MDHRLTNALVATVIAAAAAALSGCQSYRPRPLDTAAHWQAWQERTPAEAAVWDFVSALARQGDAAAAEFDPADGLSLSEAELVALVLNPDLRLARLRAGVAAASAQHAGLWDDPELAVDVLRIVQNVPSPWVVTPALGFTIPISGRLEAEKARAGARLHAELDRVAEAEWRVRSELRTLWLEWSATMLRLQESERLVTSMDSLVRSTAQLAEQGEMLRTEAALFAIEQVQRRTEMRRWRGIADEHEQQLLMLMGLAPQTPVVLHPTLNSGLGADPDPAGPPLRNPSLRRLEQEYEVAEQTLHAEIRKQYPDLTIGPIFESDQGQSRIGFLGAIPIPILNANRRGIAEAAAEREFARAAYETQAQQLAGQIAAAKVRAGSSRHQREQVERELVPLVDRQLVDARRLIELGERSGLILLESLIRAHQARVQLIDLRLDEARAAAELAFLAGPPPPATPPSIDVQTDGPSVETTP